MSPQFRIDYPAVIEAARDPSGCRGLAEMLRLWRLRTVTYDDREFEAHAAVSAGPTTLEPELLVAGNDNAVWKA